MTSTPAKKSGDGADMRQMLAEVEARRASAMDEAGRARWPGSGLTARIPRANGSRRCAIQDRGASSGRW